MFLVVDCSSAYNAKLGHPTLNSWKAITLTYHLMIKFSTEYGVWRGTRRSSSSVRMLHCYVGNGRSFADYVYRGTADGGRTSGRIERSSP